MQAARTRHGGPPGPLLASWYRIGPFFAGRPSVHRSSFIAVLDSIRTADGRGYWILSSNGAIASYGDAINDASSLGQVDALTEP